MKNRFFKTKGKIEMQTTKAENEIRQAQEAERVAKQYESNNVDLKFVQNLFSKMSDCKSEIKYIKYENNGNFTGISFMFDEDRFHVYYQYDGYDSNHFRIAVNGHYLLCTESVLNNIYQLAVKVMNDNLNDIREKALSNFKNKYNDIC